MKKTNHSPARVLDLGALRARLAKARSDPFEMESLSAPGELLMLISNVDQIRSKMMTVCSEIAPRLIQIETADEAHRIIATAIFSALERVVADARASAIDDSGGPHAA